MPTKTRNIVYIILSAVIVAVVLYVEFGTGTTEEEKTEKLIGITKDYSDQIQGILSTMQGIPDSIARVLSVHKYDDAKINEMLKAAVKDHPNVYGSTCSFEPYMQDKNSYYFSPYYYKHGDTVLYQNLGTPSYDYFIWSWYLVPKRLGTHFWSEPYFDEGGGNTDMITYSVPFFRDSENGKKFTGIVTVDLAMSWLDKIIGPLDLNGNGFALLISSTGTVVSSNNAYKKWRLKESLFSIAQEENWHNIHPVGENVEGGEGIKEFTDGSGVKYIFSYKQLGKNNLSFLVALREDKI